MKASVNLQKSLKFTFKNCKLIKYQNRELAYEGLKQQAYAEHEEIYRKELSDIIDEFTAEGNKFLKPALRDIKYKFVEKLKSSNSQFLF